MGSQQEKKSRQRTIKKSDSHRQHRFIAGVCLLIAFIMVVFSAVTSLPQAIAKTVDLTSLNWEIAATPEARAQGLSGRESLPSNQGMLFLFDQPGIYPFWMKDVKFALDIIWIRDGQVVDVATLPPPSDDSFVPPSHIPRAQADSVIELNAGMASELGLQKGSTVILPR